jgi:LDH2 family malate/lactate/ureidoglycolate dehydrogenase
MCYRYGYCIQKHGFFDEGTIVEMINLSLSEVDALAIEVLCSNGMGSDHARAIAQVITAGQRDECHSHGIYRLIVCVRSLREGKLVGDAKPVVTDVSPAVVRVDAGFGYSQLAFEIGSKVLVEKSKRIGIAALAINNCFHFSALWPEVERLASEGLAAIAMTPSHSWVAPAGGTKPVFGTNPIAFAYPRPGPFPFVFDFATSAIARGDIELHRRQGKEIPLGWAVDEAGASTKDPVAALRGAMLTFGGHKGSALSAMVELLAGPLIGDLTSAESQRFDEGVGATPCHGELVIAFNPAILAATAAADNEERAEALFDSIVGQGARLPSQRRFEARLRSEASGVNVPKALLDEVRGLIRS